MNTPRYEIDVPIPFYSQRVDLRTALADGFASVGEAEHWIERGCGIACLRMIVDGFRARCGLSSTVRQGEMIHQGLDLGAYCDRGWIHAGLVKLAGLHHLGGACFRGATIDDLVRELRCGHPCIASISVGFEGGLVDEGGRPRRPGGHLAVVLGFLGSNAEGGLVVNHPSSDPNYEWERRQIDRSAFAASFAGAFMSFWDATLCGGE